MRSSAKLLYGLGFTTLLATTTAFATVGSSDRMEGAAEASAGKWRLQATGVRIIGGYGHNFAYDGENVRWLEGGLLSEGANPHWTSS